MSVIFYLVIMFSTFKIIGHEQLQVIYSVAEIAVGCFRQLDNKI